MTRTPKSDPSVFIIESLALEDEDKERFEGRILDHILRLAKKQTTYRYIRTAKELKTMLDEFTESGMRYLHLSCHGNMSTVALTLDELSFRQFGDLVRPHLENRRLFMSACEVVNDELARVVLPKSGCNSVIGPKKAISFGDAAIMWASFYHLMFRNNPEAMRQDLLKSVLRTICDAFDEPFLYYRSSRSSSSGFKKYTYS